MSDEPCTCPPRSDAGAGLTECPRVDECYGNWLDARQTLSIKAVENLIDDIRNTIVEAYDDTLDYTGPNWEHIARKVYEKHLQGGSVSTSEVMVTVPEVRRGGEGTE